MTSVNNDNNTGLSEAILTQATRGRQPYINEGVNRGNSAKTITRPVGFDVRNDDNALLQLMDRLAWPIVIAMIVILGFVILASPVFLQRFAMPSVAVLMGMYIVWFLLTTARTATKRHMVMLLLLGAFVVLSAFPWQSMRIAFLVLTFVITPLQVILLFWTLWSHSLQVTESQEAFRRTLKVLYTIATITSLVFISKSFQTWPSMSSFYSAMACYFCFAYATSFVGALFIRSGSYVGGNGDEANIIFSCDAISSDTGMQSGGSMTCFSILLNTCVAILFFLLWPPSDANNTDLWYVGLLCPSLLASQTVSYHKRLFVAARRFHVRSDGSILVETMGKTYDYPPAIRASLEPLDGVIPKQTNICHVYCASGADEPRAVVELSGGGLLYVTPKQLAEFVNATTRAISQSKA